MSDPIYLSNISSVVPQYRLDQNDIAEQQIELWELQEDEARRLRHLFSKVWKLTSFAF
jgi:hypothetical protein